MREEAIAANRRPLDWLSFFLADVQGGIGPFLAIYLLGSRHWNPGEIGVVLTIAGIATVVARGPAGALVDAVTWKRTLIALAAGTIMATASVMALWPYFWPVAIAQGLTGAADAVFPAALSGISLGIVGRQMFTRRIGRNEAFNHGGNAATAIAAGLAGYLIAPGAVLWIVVALALASIVACYRVDGRAIDHELARGADDGDNAHQPTGLKLVFENRSLLMFTAAITLFHFANAAMLPLLGENLARSHAAAGSLFMASCIITAQVVMVPMAIMVGRHADAWGRKPIFLAGFAVLPVRGFLYTLTTDPTLLISIQILDGVGAGIFGALFPVVVADLTKGSGRYNLAQGASGACWGLGAAMSNGVAGEIVNAAGFDTAFLFLAGCALAALLVFWLGVPETRDAAIRAAPPAPLRAVAD
ncbi:MAG: MFS transporter [Alphaproteobacteria bacterium]|nr:MFS transporter [Alphaproteobacteria bacterium]